MAWVRNSRRTFGAGCIDDYGNKHRWFGYMPRVTREREMYRANCLDNLVRVSQNSASLNGFESGGGHFPAGLRLFRTRNLKK